MQAYLLVTAAAAALPITIRMRSAVVIVFTDAIEASIVLGFLAYAALALYAMLSGCQLLYTDRSTTASLAIYKPACS